MLVVKWSWRNEGFEGKKRREMPKVLNKATKTVFRDTKYETRQGSSHIISEPGPERIMKSECLKFAPEMAKKKKN